MSTAAGRFPHLHQPDPILRQGGIPQKLQFELRERLNRSEAENERLLEEIAGLRRHQEEREDIIRDLVQTLIGIKLLHGLLPICSSCKKIRDDTGVWHFIESYISKHSEAEFTHGLCPECEYNLYPQLHKHN